MPAAPTPGPSRGLAPMLAWRRLRFTLLFSGLLGLMVSIHYGPGGLFGAMYLGLCGLLAFGLFERWPKRLPGWLARWALQVFGVALAMPVGTIFINALSGGAGEPRIWEIQGIGLLLGPWVALAALVRQKDALARHQALSFDLERSELERQALDARLHLLQAQVAPHFLFNTLANVQALVESGSPQAPNLLRSLIAYLRAAVPRLHSPTNTLGQELQMAEAYLDLMRMRMPDRLQFSLRVEESVRGLPCPPLTLLTLVENAVRHGIDPSEEGGRIEIEAWRRDDRCLLQVRDTGAGLRDTGNGSGTGLATLRERLRLLFGDQATLRVSAQEPRGVCAELTLPAIRPSES